MTREPLHLLLCEDVPNDAELIVKELRKAGLEVRHRRVETAEDLRAALSGSEWDAVLSDYRMPGLDAPAALAIVKEIAPDLPFIIVSGAVGEELAVDVLRTGAADFISKFNLARLAPAVVRAVQENRRRRQLDSRLADIQERLAMTLRGSNTGLWDYDLATGQTYLSEVWKAQLGYQRDELPDDYLEWESRLHPEDRERTLEAFRKSLEPGGPPYEVEFRLRHKDGSYRSILSRGAIYRDAAGRAVRAAGVHVDITALRQAEAAQRSLESRLNEAVKLEALARLAGGVAHDFNNLMSGVIGFAELLMMRFPAGGEQKQYLLEIKKAGERAVALTRQLLAFGRRSPLQPRVVSLNTVVADFEDFLWRIIGEDVALVVEPQAAARVRVDPGQIEQVLMNLAANARDAMPRGGTLTVRTADLEILHEDSVEELNLNPGRYVVLEVADTGAGMTPEVAAKCFEPFFTTKERGKGTGLGLATVYGIVKQSGGHIEVHSVPDRGTVFRILLLAVTEQEDSSSTGGGEMGAITAADGRQTVLVVEDEDMVRRLIGLMLKGAGYEVIEVSHPADALQVVQSRARPVHLVLTDMVMPDMSGRELAERIGRIRPGLRVVYMSGYDGDADRPAPECKGLQLQKPFTVEELTRTIREAFSRPA